MNKGQYLRLFLKPLLVLSALPALFGLVLVVRAFVSPFALLAAGMFLLLGLEAAAVVLGTLGAVWLLLHLPSYRQFLIAGFGLTLSAGLVLWLAGIEFPDVWGITLLVALLVSPLLVGAAVVYGLDARPKLRWNSALAAAVALPITLWLPVRAMPPFWGYSRLDMVGAILFHAVMTAGITAVVPPSPAPQHKWWLQLAVPGALFAAVTAAVLQVPSHLPANKVSAAVATFKTRYPQIQVGEPVVEENKYGYWTYVKLPANDWTFELTLAKGELVDDGYANYQAATVAQAWLQRARVTYQPVGHYDVRPAPVKGMQVHVKVTDPFPATWRLTVSDGQVTEFLPPPLALFSAPVDRSRVAELIARTLGDKAPERISVAWAWERPDGAWEYGFVEDPGRYGYVVIENREVKSVSRGVPDVIWLPPHQ